MRKGKTFFNISDNQLYTWFWKRKHLILLAILLLTVYWRWWLPGPKVATDFPIVPMSDLKNQLDFPRTWFSRGSIGFGGYSIFTLWSWPMDFVVGISSNFGFGFSILERVIFVIPTLIAGIYGIWKLLENFGVSKISKFVASFFFLTNTYVLLLIDGGQLGIALAYSWFPISYHLFVKSVGGTFKDKIIAGIGLTVLGMFDIRFVYVLGVLLLIRFLFFGWNIKWITTAIIACVVYCGLNAYWILTLIKFPISNQTFSNLTQSSNLNFTQLKNSISLLQPHWFENIFGKIPPFRKEFLLIPALAFLAPILKRRNKEVWFWTFVAVISVFLTKGTNYPFPYIYSWLFTYIPGFSLFRDSTKFFFLVTLSYSVLIAITINEIGKIIPKPKLVFPFLAILYLLFLIRPVFLSQMTGTFSIPRHEGAYSQLTKILESDNDFGKIFWIPSRTPLGFASRTHVSFEANRLESLRPFVISTVGTYETQNFIREANYMGELFDILGIKYVVYPSLDPSRDNMSKEKTDYYNTFLSQISNLSWVDRKISDSSIPVFITKESQDKFFIAGSTYNILGSDSIYSEIRNLNGKFADNALIFGEEFPETSNSILAIPQAKIILYHKEEIDLIASLINKNNFIFPSQSLNTEPFKTDSSGWWKRESGDFLWWRNFLNSKYGIDNLDFDYGGGWGIAEGDNELIIKDSKLIKGNILLVRVMKSPKGGNISFYQENTKIGEVNTKVLSPDKTKIKLTGHNEIPDKFFTYDQSDFVWVNIGKLISNGNVEIRTNGDINVVNSLVSIGEDSFNGINKIVSDLYKNNKVIEWSKLSNVQKMGMFSERSNAKVSYEEVSPTHYKISVEGLVSPATLVFSDTYDSLWKIGVKSPYRLYSLINGFSIGKDGSYDLYFSPQIYVYYGLILCGTTLLISLVLILCKK